MNAHLPATKISLTLFFWIRTCTYSWIDWLDWIKLVHSLYALAFAHVAPDRPHLHLAIAIRRRQSLPALLSNWRKRPAATISKIACSLSIKSLYSGTKLALVRILLMRRLYMETQRKQLFAPMPTASQDHASIAQTKKVRAYLKRCCKI